jgi:DNA replication and repair protein RecF
MVLEQLSIINYKNIGEAQLRFSPKINCFIGNNGAGKTNVLDAIFFLSFCHSASTTQDQLVLRHGEEMFVLEGKYADFDIFCGMKRGTKKHFKRDGKEYKRLSEHIGLIPIVMVSPADTALVDGGSEERRRQMDLVIAQMNRPYMEALNRYNKALQQRNALLRDEEHEPDPALMELLEEQMASEGEKVYVQRRVLVEQLSPIFEKLYQAVAGGNERVELGYVSHCQRGPLLDTIRRDRQKDRAVGYSLHGIHRDDLEIMLDGHPMRREGSQGQLKTFVIALKLAQYELLARYELHGLEYVERTERDERNLPLLLLDDIFDKLDATRVEQIVKLVASPGFGQIFITDTNRDHLDSILTHGNFDHRIFHVEDGVIQ